MATITTVATAGAGWQYIGATADSVIGNLTA